MTKNQIEYNKLLETQRSNRAQESLTEKRDNRAYEVSSGTLSETKRHNVAAELVSSNTLAETKRSNLAREEENYRSNVAKESENVRHNTAVEVETRRSNVAGERLRSRELSEQSRHNLQTESVGRTQAQASMLQATASQRQALVAASRAQEEARHNATVEDESHRANVARETETNRNNVAVLAETIRSNQERERENAAHHTAEDVFKGIDTVSKAVNTGVGIYKTILGLKSGG